MNRPREDGKLFYCYIILISAGLMGRLAQTQFFLKYIYKNIEAEILRIKSGLRFLKRIDIILCVETSVNTIQFSFVFLTV